MFKLASHYTLASALTLALVFVTGSAKAQDEVPAAAPMGALPLNIGNLEVGGSASYRRNVRTNDRLVSVTPKAEYFFANRFSAGGTLNYTDIVELQPSGATLSGNSFGLGPSATFYITHTERTALSVDQSILFTKPASGDNYIQGATGLALDYFFSPSIAFGPSLRAIYYFNGGVNKPDDAVRLGFDFSLFL